MSLVMMGTGSFGEPTFLKLLEGTHPVVGLVTQPDRAAGKERGSTRQARQSMKEIALERGIPVLQPESINTPEGVESLKQRRPDLLVVAAYGQILSKDVLSLAALGGTRDQTGGRANDQRDAQMHPSAHGIPRVGISRPPRILQPSGRGHAAAERELQLDDVL